MRFGANTAHAPAVSRVVMSVMGRFAEKSTRRTMEQDLADIAAEDREFLSDPAGRVVLGLDGTGEPAGFATVCDGPQRWELQFEPDALASYERSARVLEIIKASGVTKFGFVGNERYRTFGK